MANARPGGPRRPELDYYEYKRLHEQRNRLTDALPERLPPAAPAQNPPAAKVPTRAAKPAPEAPAYDAPEAADDALDLPEEKPSIFSGVRTLMKGVAHRVPAEAPEASEEDGIHTGDAEDDAREAPKAPEPEADGGEDDDVPDDAPQIDNPIGDALVKVKGFFHSARARLNERKPRKGAEAPEEAEDDEGPSREPSEGAEGGAPAVSRRMRKAAQAQERAEEQSDEPPIIDIPPVDVSEVDELVNKPGTTVHAGFDEEAAPKAAPAPTPEDYDEDDDDDDLPAARGTRLFGFFKKLRGRGTEPEPEADEESDQPGQPDGEDLLMDEDRKAVLTERLSEDLAASPTLSRRERKALASGKARPAAPAPYAAPAAPAPYAAPAAVEAPVTTYAPAPAQPAFSVDEPTQQFRPLRARAARITPPAAPLETEDDEDDEDDDLPVRRAPKPPREKKQRRVYKDEDLDDEEYEEERYDEDRYDDYDDYDDDYDEDEEDRYDDEYHVSAGRRFLGFLKGLVVLVLFLALCVLALRQMEASRLISLTGLRQTVGQIVPIDLILPSPAPDEATPEATPEPEVTQAPTEAPTQTPAEAPTEAPAETPEADGQLPESMDFPLTTTN